MSGPNMDSDHLLHKEIIKKIINNIHLKNHTIKTWNKESVQNSDSTII
jgi:hypothetical protein